MNLLLGPRLIFWRPAGASVALHALLLAMLTLNWSWRQPPTVQTAPPPNFISAKLVAAPQPPPPEPARRSLDAVPAPVPAPAQPKPKPAPVQPASKPRPEPPAEVISEPTAQTEGPSAAQRAARAREELAQLLAAETAMLERSDDETTALSYIALISRSVESHWSRPPSARNGMEVELVIQLIPTGEVVSVTVVRGSGLAAFDRSAVNAVRKAGRFPELQQLPSRIFESRFRQFRLLFKPEDLRF